MPISLSTLLLVPALLVQEGAPAGADAGAAPAESPFGGMLVPMALCMAVVFFFLILPERKARKRREQMLRTISKGDKVITNGGLYGTVVQVQENVATLQIADNVRARFAVSAIQQVLSEEPAAETKKGGEKAPAAT